MINNNLPDERSFLKMIKITKFNSEIDSLVELEKIVEKAYSANKDFFGQEVEGTEIDFIYTREEMDKVRGCKTQNWLVGDSNKNKITIFSPKVYSKVSNHPASDFFPTLTHEIAHVFLKKLFSGKGFPVWLDEGVAGYIAKQYKKYQGVKFEMIDFSKIGSYPGWQKYNPYSQVFLFTKYLFDLFGKKKMLGFLKFIVASTEKNFALKFREYFDKNFEEVVSRFSNAFNLTI